MLLANKENALSLKLFITIACCAVTFGVLFGTGCARQLPAQPANVAASTAFENSAINDTAESEEDRAKREAKEAAERAKQEAAEKEAQRQQRIADLEAELNITKDFRDSFDHGEKPADKQKYIVLHDTEGDGDAQSVIDWWDSNGNLVASQFIINKDGSIYQCVPMDRIAHHAGYGDTGHNDQFGITEDGRDDMAASVPIGDWASDYGMNAWSIGIEMVHVGGSGDYPEAQLASLDKLIEYIDAYYGFESTIIDHKDWRSGNTDTSPEFAPYLENYKATRTHNG